MAHRWTAIAEINATLKKATPMQRNWHIICTKKRQEKKVTEFLARKGIENYCPFTNREITISASKKIIGKEALFNSYVFVFVHKDEITLLKKIPYVINMVYWKLNPVIIAQEEINAIMMMEDNYTSIRLEKRAITMNEKVEMLEENICSQNSNTLTIKHNGIAVILPSLGYVMTAQREHRYTKQPQKEPPAPSSFLKRLNPLFLFGF